VRKPLWKRVFKRRDQLARVAEQTFGWEQLRPHQREAMEHVVAGHDTLVVLPTGAGKSAIYQVPALLTSGPALIVSPLLALQQDQLEGIGESGAPEAVAINSMQSAAERDRAWAAIRRGAAKYVFLAPEQLAKEETVAELAELRIRLFVVDEAHCVSAWGHDFRPDYLRLGQVIERLEHPVVLAMTATAALPVRQDIVARLGLRDHREVFGGFDRPNLHLRVVHAVEDEQKRREVVARVRELHAESEPHRGLVYVATRKDAERYAEELVDGGMAAAAYHAGMRGADRESVHERFLDDELDVVVATSAFGMGIDKPDVRFVVHASAPESLDSYYQQVGRAGRDGEPAAIVLCYRPEDLNLQRFLTGSRAPEDVLAEVAGVLGRHEGPVHLNELKDEVDGSAARRTRAVNLLEEAGVVATTEDGRLEYLDAGTSPGAAVAAAVEVAETRQRLVRSRIEMMRGYAETTDCRRRFLLGYFGEQLRERCGNCDTCDAGSARDEVPEDGEFRVGRAVRHAQWGDGVVTSSDDSELTALFEEVGYKTLALQVVRERGLLEAVGPR
jgi:ATP-dependent DNA helicase RecQ